MNKDATPASNETKLGLLNHDDLNIHEAYALEKTWKYLLDHNSEKLDLLLVNQSHKHGFDSLYDWAGQFRRTTPMVGQLQVPEPHQLTELLKRLFDDLDYKIQNLDKDNIDEVINLLTWFEYKFIWIHPYTNTNGRMARLLSNFILIKLGYPPLQYANRSADRKKYIEAMHKADDNDFEQLENFIADELDKAINSID